MQDLVENKSLNELISLYTACNNVINSTPLNSMDHDTIISE